MVNNAENKRFHRLIIDDMKKKTQTVYDRTHFFSIVISVKSCGSIDQNCKKKNKERNNITHNTTRGYDDEIDGFRDNKKIMLQALHNNHD